MNILNTAILALLGGIVPALAWLYYWLREDAHPEPKKIIFRSFLFGMLAVPVALFIQSIVSAYYLNGSNIEAIYFDDFSLAILIIILWAASEEIVKYLAAYFGGIRSRDNDEPLDVTIYMITAALGFAAVENTLFIFWPLLSGNSTAALITGSYRFVGSTMLHVATSAIIGLFASFSFYKNKEIRHYYLIAGFAAAITLHTLFNSFIIKAGDFTLISFGSVWFMIILIIMLLEKIKKIYIKKTALKN